MSSTDDNKKVIPHEVQIAQVKADIEIKKIEASSNAKEVASKYIGKTAIPWIVLLVAIGVASSLFLKAEAMPAVVGLVSTAVMALITMLSGITGTKDKEDKPEFTVLSQLLTQLQEEKLQKNEIINSLIQQMNEEKNQQMSLNVDKDKVTVTKGSHKVETKK